MINLRVFAFCFCIIITDGFQNRWSPAVADLIPDETFYIIRTKIDNQKSSLISLLQITFKDDSVCVRFALQQLGITDSCL